MNALSSFIGAAGEREQTVWTPEWVLDAVDKVFPDGWGDPFWSEGSPASTRSRLRHDLMPCRDAKNAEGHFDRNFRNPPYSELKDFFPLSADLWKRYDIQGVDLVPVRTRREWWCRAAAGACVAYLKPVTFLDAKTGLLMKGSMPENMAAIYWGERKALFTLAFAPHSHHIQQEF